MVFFGRRPAPQALQKLGLAFTVVLTLLACNAPEAKGPSASIGTVTHSELPPEARHTERLIRLGGPFPYPHKDGSVFGNRESILAMQPRGFYREYTVKTPGARNRGARRIVCGGRQPKDPEACFYTDDHYASFRLIVH